LTQDSVADGTLDIFSADETEIVAGLYAPAPSMQWRRDDGKSSGG
jgi:hypothetical protein